MSLIVEFPHADYNDHGIDAIDFQLEKMPISNDDKEKYAKSFYNGGIIGKMAQNNKYLLFKPDSVQVLKNKPKNKLIVLPNDWQKYTVILKDGRIDMSKRQNLKELLRSIIREIIAEKWKNDVKVKSTGEHADKTIEQLKKEIEALKGKSGNKEKMGELLFALRAKQGWKKGEGSTGLPKSEGKAVYLGLKN